MRKAAAITFDMDELDVLAEGYGVKDPFRPVVYAKAVPRMLELLSETGIKASFYVIGRDAKDAESRAALKEIAGCGHEIGNHSYGHKHLLRSTIDETREDTVRSTGLLEDITGRKISGYRGPSLTFNDHLMEILLDLGYEYDTSVNPTFFFIGEWFYLFFSRASIRNKPDLFFVRHALSPSSPYGIAPPSFFKRRHVAKMVELPISHVPFLNVPFYATFHFLFPFSYSFLKGLFYTNPYLVYHAHALDFLDIEKDGIPGAFRKHPGLGMPWPRKREYFKKVFEEIKVSYPSVGTAREMARLFKKEIN